MKFSVTKEQFDWWMDNLGSPAGPLAWFKRPQPLAGAARWGMLTVSYLALIVWAVFFIWLWFAVFCVLFLYEGLGLAPWTRGGKLQSEKVEE
jgi:hypothetical protein